jgi:hypothetical protein
MASLLSRTLAIREISAWGSFATLEKVTRLTARSIRIPSNGRELIRRASLGDITNPVIELRDSRNDGYCLQSIN